MHPRYEHLSALLGGWFHQDFDLGGDSIAVIIRSYRRSGNAREIEDLRQEIRRFLASHPKIALAAFEEIFDLDIEISAFASTVETFLLEIDAALAEPATDSDNSL